MKISTLPRHRRRMRDEIVRSGGKRDDQRYFDGSK